jgi:hypothetical protein
MTQLNGKLPPINFVHLSAFGPLWFTKISGPEKFPTLSESIKYKNSGYGYPAPPFVKSEKRRAGKE